MGWGQVTDRAIKWDIEENRWTVGLKIEGKKEVRFAVKDSRDALAVLEILREPGKAWAYLEGDQVKCVSSGYHPEE